MPDILLINPPYLKKVYGKNRNFALHPPLGLAYVASWAQSNGITVEIIDANAEGLTLENTVSRVVARNPRLIGITAVTSTISLVYKLSSLIKKEVNASIILGGPHVTFMAEHTLKESRSIDIVVRGEGEKTLVDVYRAIEKCNGLRDIRGVTYRDNKEIISTLDRDHFKDINHLRPARQLLPLDKYRPGPLFDNGVSGRYYAKILSARGCPNKCTFCSSSHFWKKLRLRSPEDILSEIEELIRDYDIKRIDFVDDCFTIPVERLRRVCQGMIERGYNISWTCYSRVTSISEDIVEVMKESGCFGLQFGIEGGDQAILNNIRKNVTLREIENAVNIVNSFDIKCMGDFMIGLPGDSEETIKRTIRFAKRLNLDLAFFSITTPFPGTELFSQWLADAELPIGFNWDQLSLHQGGCYHTGNLDPVQVARMYKMAIERYYFSIPTIMHILSRILRHPDEITSYFKLLRSFTNF